MLAYTRKIFFHRGWRKIKTRKPTKLTKIRIYLRHWTTFSIGPPQYGSLISLKPSLLSSKIHTGPPLRRSSPLATLRNKKCLKCLEIYISKTAVLEIFPMLTEHRLEIIFTIQCVCRSIILSCFTHCLLLRLLLPCETFTLCNDHIFWACRPHHQHKASTDLMVCKNASLKLLKSLNVRTYTSRVVFITAYRVQKIWCH